MVELFHHTLNNFVLITAHESPQLPIVLLALGNTSQSGYRTSSCRVGIRHHAQTPSEYIHPAQPKPQPSELLALLQDSSDTHQVRTTIRIRAHRSEPAGQSYILSGTTRSDRLSNLVMRGHSSYSNAGRRRFSRCNATCPERGFPSIDSNQLSFRRSGESTCRPSRVHRPIGRSPTEFHPVLFFLSYIRVRPTTHLFTRRSVAHGSFSLAADLARVRVFRHTSRP